MLIICFSIILLWWLAPPSRALPFDNRAYWGDGFYPPEKQEITFRWAGSRATLHAPAQAIGEQQLVLALQSGRNVAVPVRMSAERRVFSFDVEPAPRVYQVLVKNSFSLHPLDIQLSAPTFRPTGDSRALSFVITQAGLYPLHGSVPWWLLTAVMLVFQAALLHIIPLPRRLPDLIRPALLVVWVSVLLWFHKDSYDHRMFAFALVAIAGTIAVSGVLPANRYIGSLPATRMLWRRLQRYRRATPAHLDIQVAAWDRTAFVIASALAVTAVCIRFVLAPAMSWYLGGDDYLVGVFTINVLHGDRPLYYGHHTGTLASYLAAPLLTVAGVSLPGLMLLPIVLTAILIVTLYGLGRDLFGAWGGITAAIWMALPSFHPMLWTLKPQPGYLEALTFATLALWLTIRLLWGRPTRAGQIWLMLGIGITATCAVWAGYVIAPIMLICGLAGLLAGRRVLRLPPAGYVLLVAILALGWLLPLLLYIERFPRANPIWYLLEAPRPASTPGVAFQGFMTYQLPTLLTGDARIATLAQYSILGSTLAAFLYAAIIAVYYKSKAAIVVLGIVFATIGMFVFSSFGYLFTDVRYILPLVVAVPLLLAGITAAVSRVRHGYIWAAVLLLGTLLLNSFSLYGRTSLDFVYHPRDEAALAQRLQQMGIRFIHSSYWIAMPVMFESRGGIVAATIVGPNRTSYDQRNEQRVLEAHGEATAFVFKASGQAKPAFENYLDRHRITCDKIPVRHFIAYTRCTPFPDVIELSRKIPVLVDE